MTDPTRDCFTDEIQCIITFPFLNLDATHKLTQAEIISADYKTKNCPLQKSQASTNPGLQIKPLIYNLITPQGTKRKLNQFGIICSY